MKQYKTMAHINSLNGKLKEIMVLDKIDDNKYKVNYNGTICSAIFNWYVCSYYVDDLYGKLEN